MACLRCATLERCLCLDRPAAWSPSPAPADVGAELERLRGSQGPEALGMWEQPLRSADDIRAEIYGQPPYRTGGLKHGPGGSGGPGPCDVGFRKCALMAELQKAYRMDRQAVVRPDRTPDEECARCGTVGPVSESCRGCQVLPSGTTAPEMFPRSPAGQHDDATPLPPKPCAQRHPDGERWCYLADGHEGDHRAPTRREMEPVDFGPKAATSTRRGRA